MLRALHTSLVGPQKKFMACFRDAKAIRVKPDKECALAERTYLSFYADADCTQLLREYTKDTEFKPFVRRLPEFKFWYGARPPV